MEILVGVFFAVWIALYYWELSAPKATGIAKHAWFARFIKIMMIFFPLGALCVSGEMISDNPAWLQIVGIAILLVGAALSIRCLVQRDSVQKGLESGEIEPITEGSIDI